MKLHSDVYTLWKNSLFNGAMFITLYDEKMNPEKLINLWFNTYYFHSDDEKEVALKKLNEAFKNDFAKFMLLDAVYNASKVIFIFYDGVLNIVNARRENL